MGYAALHILSTRAGLMPPEAGRFISLLADASPDGDQLLLAAAIVVARQPIRAPPVLISYVSGDGCFDNIETAAPGLMARRNGR